LSPVGSQYTIHPSLIQYIFNKISGTSSEQWMPRDLHLCWQLIYDDLMSGAIEEVTFKDGQEVNREWILHRFDLETF
jgi:hypothetical protein